MSRYSLISSHRHRNYIHPTQQSYADCPVRGQTTREELWYEGGGKYKHTDSPDNECQPPLGTGPDTPHCNVIIM